jgi:hypothetical protein
VAMTIGNNEDVVVLDDGWALPILLPVRSWAVVAVFDQTCNSSKLDFDFTALGRLSICLMSMFERQERRIGPMQSMDEVDGYLKL